MKVFLVLYTMCVVTASAAFYETQDDIQSYPTNTGENNLYNSVVAGDIDTAVDEAMDLYRQSKGSIIEDVVMRLMTEKKRNLMEFAYKLWVGIGCDIVKQYFPSQFSLIFAERHVKIINKRDSLALKLSVAIDEDYDRSAWGDANDKTTDNVGWKFVPVWEGTKVYFKILSTGRNQYLKLGIAADYMGDHTAYGANIANTFRHQWYLQPVLYENDVLFIIYNREYNQCLKLGRAVDDIGDRRLYGNNGNVAGSPELFGFYITPL